MIIATKELLQNNDLLYEKRKSEILNTQDNLSLTGDIYYVSNAGNDENDGKTPVAPWKSLEKVSEANLKSGDGVLFKRGDLFRGRVVTKPGVSYGAYGEGEKPKFYSGEKDYAEEALWELYDAAKNIWKCKEKMRDAGTFVFNHGQAHSRKLIPSYINGKFVCREDESRVFDVRNEMTENLDLYWHFEEKFSTSPSKGESFPVPDTIGGFGDLYLRCDEGNPGAVFDSIEHLAGRHMFLVGTNDYVTIDNLCIKYVGMHGIAAGGGLVKGLKVTNCEIGWIGGAILHYSGMDPNYPQGGRGTVTRYGNGIEIYGACEDYTVSNCYVYEVYDAGITHQVTAPRKITMTKIKYTNNLLEKCVYGIEYFLDIRVGGEESYMDDVVMQGNLFRLSGYGWGQQRHNVDTPAHIKGWSFQNTATNYFITDNIFDRCAYRMLHLVAEKAESCPEMNRNTYIQHENGMLGQYGSMEIKEPEILPFDETAEQKINDILGDRSAKVYIIN